MARKPQCSPGAAATNANTWPLQVTTGHHPSGGINAVHLKNRLRDVQSDCSNPFTSVAPPDRGRVSSSQIHGTRVPAGETANSRHWQPQIGDAKAGSFAGQSPLRVGMGENEREEECPRPRGENRIGGPDG
jgi:hypothetical protein